MTTIKPHPIREAITIIVFIFLKLSLFAQVESIACICELESILLESKIDMSQVIIEEAEDGGYLWKIEETEEVQVQKPIPEPKAEIHLVEIPEAEERTSSVKSAYLKRTDRNRKRKSLKRKVKNRKKKRRKYKGQCPNW